MTADPHPNPRQPFTLPSTRGRDWAIGITLAVIVVGLLFYAVSNISVRSTVLTGTITAKRFIPAPEEQVTIGRDGLHTRKVDGEYIFDVTVNDHPYNIWVDKEIYNAHKVGDSYTFVRPPE